MGHHPKVEGVDYRLARAIVVLQRRMAWRKAINESLTMVGEASFDLHINLMAIVK